MSSRRIRIIEQNDIYHSGREGPTTARTTTDVVGSLFIPGYFADFLPLHAETHASSQHQRVSSPYFGSPEIFDVKPVREVVSAALMTAARLYHDPSCNVHAQVGDENCGPLETKRVLETQQLGSFLERYWDVINERNGSLECTSGAVCTAFQQGYQDQIEAARIFSRKTLTCTEHEPCNSNISLKDMQNLLRLSYLDGWERQIRFSSLLPGFSHLSVLDRESLLRERRVEMYLVHRASFISDRVFRYGIGANNDIHPCGYFLRRMNVAEQEDFVAAFVDEFNKMGLSDLERYVFLCVALFRPDSTNFSDRAYLEFLYTHYMDLLRHLLSSRRGYTAPLNVQGELTCLLDQVRACSHSMLLQYKHAIRTDN